ncbi:hypothetical protein [Caulobacter hibisci]|uniref:Uncharacterized protein n=1 Tax=Caulobacter hibisci TaxID=2035993 RepID=A0ABS0T639_9CAUL|nr:hypothetical protein [Caulobacter hibisci]MBI1686368.1 hypothetical protein [Caulobacter hibisci]
MLTTFFLAATLASATPPAAAPAPPPAPDALKAIGSRWQVPQQQGDWETHYEAMKVITGQLVAANRCDEAEEGAAAYGYFQLGAAIRSYCHATGRTVRDGPDLKQPINPAAWGPDRPTPGEKPEAVALKKD